MEDSECLQRALEFAKEKHKGQKRIGGDDYITHPIAVSEIVKNQGFDENYQIAALFHDLLEDTDATEEEIINGDVVVSYVLNGETANATYHETIDGKVWVITEGIAYFDLGQIVVRSRCVAYITTVQRVSVCILLSDDETLVVYIIEVVCYGDNYTPLAIRFAYTQESFIRYPYCLYRQYYGWRHGQAYGKALCRHRVPDG